jgi:chemotaxis protein methyltransferase CheR
LREVVDLVERSIGVSLIGGDVERTLVPFARERARALGLAGADAYLAGLASRPIDGAEWRLLIDAVTNGQTCFFRDIEQWEAITAMLGTATRGGERLSIWSAACSTGEEPYTLAIVCAELGIDAEIVASDVNPASLARAEAGRFRAWSMRNVSEARVARWFAPDAGGSRVRGELRDTVRFVPHNLVRDTPLRSSRTGGRWDLVLCRNVLIYFRRRRVAQVCGRLLDALTEGGALVISASESLTGLEIAARPEMVGRRIVYRRDRAAAAQSPRARVVRPPPPPPPPSQGPGYAEIATLATTGRVAEARRLLDRAADPEPGIEAVLTFGHLDVCEHDFDGALARYTRATEIDSLLSEGHYFVGVVHRKRGRWREAAEALRRALFLTPTFWQASYMLSGACRRLGRDAAAAREEARTRKLLVSEPPIMALLSHPLFVDRLGVSADEVRRAWSIS